MATFKDTEIFIKSGWNVIPYDRIYYAEDGRKIATPQIQWKRYKTQPNTQTSPAGALICGSQIVIDCDSDSSTQTILNLIGADITHLQDPDLRRKLPINFIVKTKKGYHFYFKGDKHIPDLKGDKLDVQATDNRLIYLPTKASEGKDVIHCVVDADGRIELTNIPKSIKDYVLSLRGGDAEAAENKKVRYTAGTPLAKIERGSDLYYRRLTPRSYRDNIAYTEIIQKQGYLHPNNVNDGDGNDYMIKVASILASDSTIDINAFWDNINFINEQWDRPLTAEALYQKVYRYTDGTYIPFNYDPEWERVKYAFIDREGKEIIILFDRERKQFIIADMDKNKVTHIKTSEIATYFAHCFGETMRQSELAMVIPLVTIANQPDLPFGFVNNKVFNICRRSRYVERLNDTAPIPYDEVQRINTQKNKVYAFLQHLFQEQLGYFLAFLKRKLTTFEYSPIIFWLYDHKGGAGKGVLENLLRRIVDSDNLGKMGYDEFRTKFTGAVEGKVFVFLNEFPEELKDRRFVTDKLKDLSGGDEVSIERKGQDSYIARNYTTFILTSNRICVELKEADRRFAVVYCQQTLVERFGPSFYEELMNEQEIMDFILYLKLNVAPLEDLAYRNAPLSEFKKEATESVEGNTERVARLLIENKIEELYDEFKDVINLDTREANITHIALAMNVNTRTLKTQVLLKAPHKVKRIRKVKGKGLVYSFTK